jgi:hypothetical protein
VKAGKTPELFRTPSFRSLTRKGKRPNVIVTAIARELSAFVWAINREVMGSPATAN